jgi:hypothetical protein
MAFYFRDAISISEPRSIAKPLAPDRLAGQNAGMGQERDDDADDDLPTLTDGPSDVLVGVGVYLLIGSALAVIAILLSPLRPELFG